MRHVAREVKRVARRQLVGYARDGEYQAAFDDMRDLFLRMGVFRHATARPPVPPASDTSRRR